MHYWTSLDITREQPVFELQGPGSVCSSAGARRF